MNTKVLYILNDQLQQALQAQKLERVTSILRDMQDEIINIQMREAKERIKRRIREELSRKETARQSNHTIQRIDYQGSTG